MYRSNEGINTVEIDYRKLCVGHKVFVSVGEVRKTLRFVFSVSREKPIALLSCLAVSPRAARKPTPHYPSVACSSCSRCLHHLGTLLLFFPPLQMFLFSSARLFSCGLTLLSVMFFKEVDVKEDFQIKTSITITLVYT